MNSSDNNTYPRDFIYTCPSKVFNDPSLTLNEIKIYMMIRSFMDTTGEAYPSNNWIADHIGINRRNTINNINKLIAKGYIERFTHERQRYLRIKVSGIAEKKVPKNTPKECRKRHSPSVAKDTPPSVAKDTQLYQSNIISKDIKREEKRSSRTPISDNFFPNETHELFASVNNINLSNETSSFIDYYKAHGKNMLNWNAAFSNWLRKSLSFGSSSKVHPVTASIREFKQIMCSDEFKSMLN